MSTSALLSFHVISVDELMTPKRTSLSVAEDSFVYVVHCHAIFMHCKIYIFFTLLAPGNLALSRIFAVNSNRHINREKPIFINILTSETVKTVKDIFTVFESDSFNILF